MTIVLEDRRFFKHYGVDLHSVLREVSKALTLRRHGGFSTIDMQFVRTITGFRQHTIRRKVYEIVLALALSRIATSEQFSDRISLAPISAPA